MQVSGTHYRTIWPIGAVGAPLAGVRIIDQTRLPHAFVLRDLTSLGQAAQAIRDMWVRGAPLIGATAAWGVALHMLQDPSDAGLSEAHGRLLETRPTAVNLAWALDMMRAHLAQLAPATRAAAARARAAALCDQDVEINRRIGLAGLPLIRAIAARKGGAAVNILTHCNAGWLATVDWGTATAPIYMAAAEGIALHVWVDETRPRNQGAHLTAWEMAGAGIPHHLIVDNAGGHLMQKGAVDLVIVGTDRTSATGDVANKIGTYLKALAAYDCGVPFYVALPSPTIDWGIRDGLAEIPIEQRSPEEVHWLHGSDAAGASTRVRISPEATPAANPAFDVTPARLISGLITERGVCDASAAGLGRLFPDLAGRAPAKKAPRA